MSTEVLSSINSPTISLAQLTWALIVSSSPVANRDTLSTGNTQSSCYHLSTDIEIQLCSGTYFSYSAIFFKTQVWYASVPFSLVSTPIDNFFWPASHDDRTWIPGNIEWSPYVQWWWYHDQKLKYAQYCSWFPNNICYKWWVNDRIRNRTSSPPWTCSGSLHWIIKGISGFPTETMMPREVDASSKYQWSLSTKLVCEPSDGTALRAAFDLYPILTDWSNLLSLKLLTDHIFHRSISTSIMQAFYNLVEKLTCWQQIMRDFPFPQPCFQHIAILHIFPLPSQGSSCHWPSVYYLQNPHYLMPLH